MPEVEEISPQKRRYWEYQYRLMREYLIPLLEEWGLRLRGIKVADLGCAEAGGLVALAEVGAEVCGLELRASRAELARRLAAERGIELRVVVGNLLNSAD
ncbi:MAG: class I SAM-dependent methyltransferase, partial [Calditrichaeota bacterium]|nr:class I SAM-dependent methyltransferase [Calditrichota bacterium]